MQNFHYFAHCDTNEFVMNKYLYFNFVIAFLLVSGLIFSQDKMLTLEDAVYLNPEVLPKKLNQLQWMGKSENFTWVENNELIKCSVLTDEKKTIVRLDDFNAAFNDMNVDSIKRFPSITFIDDVKFRFIHKDKLFVFNVISKNIIYANYYYEGGKHIDVHDETNQIAYTIDNNLYVAVNNEQTQVTNDTDKGIVNGQTVHRNEFGISKGTFWSPSGKYLAFYRKDETMVTDYPLVDIDTRIAQVKNIKYPMSGMTSEQVKLGIFNLSTKETVFIDTGEPADQYLTCVTWDPSGEYIYIALLNRDQNYLKLNKYDVASGNYVYTLFEEQNPKYVEPEHPMYFLPAKPDQFVWMSERDGYQHLYLYQTNGRLIKQLTGGNWVVTDFIGTDDKGKTIFFRATKDSPIEKNIYSAGISSGKITRITPDHGTHSAFFGRGNNKHPVFSYSGDYILDEYSSTDVASEYKLLNSQGGLVRIVQGNTDPLKEYDLGEMSLFTLKSDDGQDLYCRLIKPAGFEEGKKYPVFFYVYGGPHSQLVNDSWLGAAGIFQNYMAQQGYVVFTMDNRGTACRGLEFEQSIFRNLGDLEVADQMKGVEYLKSLDFVDPDRIGVDGWSYGGFITISMMLKHPGVFKVACAGGPVIDWKYYEVMYGERYMDTPKTNPEGYENANLLNLVDQLEGKLLILQGTMDNTVVWQNSLTFIKRCVDEEKQVDYFVYPGHKHNVRGKDRIHLYEKIRGYFDESLK